MYMNIKNMMYISGVHLVKHVFNPPHHVQYSNVSLHVTYNHLGISFIIKIFLDLLDIFEVFFVSQLAYTV